jgi:hypothetical protein
VSILLFYVLFVCKCVLLLLPPVVNPIAVNKYIYHIISYLIMYHIQLSYNILYIILPTAACLPVILSTADLLFSYYQRQPVLGSYYQLHSNSRAFSPKCSRFIFSILLLIISLETGLEIYRRKYYLRGTCYVPRYYHHL